MIAGCEQTIVPGLSTLQCYCSGYAFHLRSSFGQSAHSNLARDRLSLLPCVAKKVLEIASGKHRGFGRLQCTHCMALAVQRRGRSPHNAAGGDRATLNLSKTLCFFCGYDGTCAAPSPLIVQRRALCLCNANPFVFPYARAIPIPLPRFHALGPHPFFFHLQYQHNRVRNDARYGFGNLPVLNVVLWRITIIMQAFTELVAIRFSKTAQQNTVYPVHKIWQKKNRGLEFLGHNSTLNLC